MDSSMDYNDPYDMEEAQEKYDKKMEQDELDADNYEPDTDY